MASKNECVFEKQVVLLLVSTRTVKRICNLISVEKATSQRAKCPAMLKSNGQCLACVQPIRDAFEWLGEHLGS